MKIVNRIAEAIDGFEEDEDAMGLYQRLKEVQKLVDEFRNGLGKPPKPEPTAIPSAGTPRLPL